MVQNKALHSFFKSLFPDYRSSAIHIPSFINNREELVEFLKAIYDDEGSVVLRVFKKTNEIKRNLTLSSNSLRLIEEVKIILAQDFKISSNKVGINIKIKGEKKFTNYVLSITGKSNFEKFREHIGFYHPDKINRLNLMINSYIRLSSTI